MTETRGHCKGCGGPVLWVRTEASGAWLSRDPEPVGEGNVVLVKGKAHVLTKAELAPPGLLDSLLPGSPPPGPRYVPHRATCTNWPASNKR